MNQESQHKNQQQKEIFLIGYMGSGKSSVGKELARLTGLTLHEMDQEIEESEGMPIPKIFTILGEPYFRDLESRLLKQHSEQTNVIVSCGGGIILDPLNVEVLKERCFAVFLEGDVELLFHRVKNDANRPNAYMGGAPEEERLARFRAQYEKRKSHYVEASSLTIDINGKMPVQIAQEILSALQLQ